jgi:GNAT superfamily N-acetyltransferase
MISSSVGRNREPSLEARIEKFFEHYSEFVARAKSGKKGDWQSQQEAAKLGNELDAILLTAPNSKTLASVVPQLLEHPLIGCEYSSLTVHMNLVIAKHITRFGDGSTDFLREIATGDSFNEMQKKAALFALEAIGTSNALEVVRSCRPQCEPLPVSAFGGVELNLGNGRKLVTEVCLRTLTTFEIRVVDPSLSELNSKATFSLGHTFAGLGTPHANSIEANKLVAYGLFKRLDHKAERQWETIDIDLFEVAHEHRGQGIGKALLSLVVDKLPRDSIFLTQHIGISEQASKTFNSVGLTSLVQSNDDHLMSVWSPTLSQNHEQALSLEKCHRLVGGIAGLSYEFYLEQYLRDIVSSDQKHFNKYIATDSQYQSLAPNGEFFEYRPSIFIVPDSLFACELRLRNEKKGSEMCSLGPVPDPETKRLVSYEITSRSLNKPAFTAQSSVIDYVESSEWPIRAGARHERYVPTPYKQVFGIVLTESQFATFQNLSEPEKDNWRKQIGLRLAYPGRSENEYFAAHPISESLDIEPYRVTKDDLVRYEQQDVGNPSRAIDVGSIIQKLNSLEWPDLKRKHAAIFNSVGGLWDSNISDSDRAVLSDVMKNIVFTTTDMQFCSNAASWLAKLTQDSELPGLMSLIKEDLIADYERRFTIVNCFQQKGKELMLELLRDSDCPEQIRTSAALSLGNYLSFHELLDEAKRVDTSGLSYDIGKIINNFILSLPENGDYENGIKNELDKILRSRQLDNHDIAVLVFYTQQYFFDILRDKNPCANQIVDLYQEKYANRAAKFNNRFNTSDAISLWEDFVKEIPSDGK